ncbi:MAG: DUF2249 domain-containing protein [Anaerolineae bacterium]|nr:DUF2249 domain-containing protein [Anaerolineae bacterium]
MSQVTQAFREHHRELANQLSKYVAQIVQDKADADPQGFAAFLKNELLPHATGEESALYPRMDEIIRAHGKPTATMTVDHEYLTGYIEQIQLVSKELGRLAPDAQTEMRARLARLGIEVQAIFEMHLAKEERVYLPLFEQHLSLEEQQRILDTMHEGVPADVKTFIDVRPIMPAQRHPLIFQTFESLAPGEAFELVNDHSPKPLYYQFAAERAGEFTWDDVEQGPQVWRVRIGKTLKN